MTKTLATTISEQELLKIIKATKQNNHKTAFLLGFYQAMRVSEIVKLKPEDVDFGLKIIRIKQAKGNKDRNIPIAPQLRSLNRHLPVGCGVRALQLAFKRAVKKAGIDKEIKFHTLRHSGATFYLNIKKWNLRAVQQFLGHSNISTTQIYTHISADDLLEAMYGSNEAN